LKPDKNRKKKVAADEVAVVSRIRGTRAHRAAHQQLLAQIVSDALQRVPAGTGPIVEIGTGDGQLREVLPAEVLPRVQHTEPLKLAIREFEKRHPGVAIEKAGAEKLPYADGSLDAVLGLAVLDVVDDAAAVVKELHRVLRPGGVVIHLLDMSTALHGMFSVLAQGNWVAVPNAVSDPSAVRFPEDLLLIPLPQLQLVLQVLVMRQHPYAKPLRQYLELWAARPLAVRTAVFEYTQLAESHALRDVLRNLFKVAYELAPAAQKAAFAAFQGQPAASSKFFEGRLKEWFSAAAGFSVLFSDVVTRHATVPISDEHKYPYQSLCVGEHRKLPVVPKKLLTEDAAPPPPNHSLLELGVHVFVAQRV
jgi:ubiquinone/menaquinone biosynthesis C-methylase UbiE